MRKIKNRVKSRTARRGGPAPTPHGGFMSRKRHHKEIDPPYRDSVFMESLPARPVRILTEYIDPLERLRREKVGDTIVMFGSARILSRERAMAHLQKLQKAKKKRLDTRQYRVA